MRIGFSRVVPLCCLSGDIPFLRSGINVWDNCFIWIDVSSFSAVSSGFITGRFFFQTILLLLPWLSNRLKKITHDQAFLWYLICSSENAPLFTQSTIWKFLYKFSYVITLAVKNLIAIKYVGWLMPEKSIYYICIDYLRAFVNKDTQKKRKTVTKQKTCSDKPMFTSENQTRSILALRKATRYQRREHANNSTRYGAMH